MPVSGIPKKKIVVEMPRATYEQLQILAEESGRTVPGYIRYLIYQEMVEKGLPIYSRQIKPDGT